VGDGLGGGVPGIFRDHFGPPCPATRSTFARTDPCGRVMRLLAVMIDPMTYQCLPAYMPLSPASPRSVGGELSGAAIPLVDHPVLGHLCGNSGAVRRINTNGIR